MVSATREMSPFTEASRSGVPTVPRKYLETTTLVAIWLQALGTSTPRCSNTLCPWASVITASRCSHSTAS